MDEVKTGAEQKEAVGLSADQTAILREMSGLDLQIFLKEAAQNFSQNAPKAENIARSGDKLSSKLIDIENYPLINFKQDFSDFLKTLKSFPGISPQNIIKINTALIKISKIEEPQWQKIQQKQAQAMKLAKEKQKNAEKMENKRQTLTLSQKQFLNSDINFDISVLVATAEKECPNNKEQQLDYFKELLADKVFDYVEKWRTKNIPIVHQMYAKDSIKDSKKNIENIYQGKNGKSLMKFAGAGGIGSLVDGVGGTLGNIFGNMAGANLDMIEKDPILSKFFPNEGGKPTPSDILYESLKPGKDLTGQNSLEALVKTRIGKIFEKNKNGKDFSINDLSKSYFNMGSKQDIMDGARGDKTEYARFLKRKHETVTKSYRHNEGDEGTDWQGKYDEYLRNTGLAALDFPQWMEQNVRDGKFGKLEHFWNKIKDMFFGLMESLGIDWFDDDKTGAQKNKFAEEYSQALGETPSGDNPAEKPDPLITRTIDNIGNYSRFRDLFAGEKNVYVYVNEQAVDLMDKKSQATLPSSFSFTHINSLIDAHPEQAKKMFSKDKTKALNLEDIDFIAKKQGNSSETGVNILLEANAVNFSLDSEWKKGLATTLGIGGLAAGAYFLSLGVLIKLSPVVVGGALGGTYLNKKGGIGKLLEKDGFGVKYNELSKDKLSNTIVFLKNLADIEVSDIKLSKVLSTEDQKLFDNDINFEDLPKGLFKFNKDTEKFEMCGSLENLTEYTKKNKSVVPLTGDQLVLLAKYFEHSEEYESLEFETISKSWYKYDENVYNRNGEYVDGDSLPDKNFLHIDEGGTNIADDNFENLDALFEYVKNDFKVKP